MKRYHLLTNRLYPVKIIDPVLQQIKVSHGQILNQKINCVAFKMRPIIWGGSRRNAFDTLLHIVYSNIMCKCFNKAGTYLCADNLKFIDTNDIYDAVCITQKIQHEVNKVDNWCKRWSLTRNTEKCSYVL